MHISVGELMEVSFFCPISGPSITLKGLHSFDTPDNLAMIFFPKQDSVKTAGALLHIPVEELLEALRIRTITAGKQQQIFKKPCSRAECETRRDCLAKVIYAK